MCTVLMLALDTHATLGRPLGRQLHVQLDNTTAENKNRTLIGLVALLVAWHVFDSATVFFMPVGHTYNDLDATFGPLITALLATVVPTISALLKFIQRTLSIKKIRVVRNLQHLWDFTAFLEPHMHKIQGFANTQQSSGMHEFLFSRDPQGDVRMHARQSSQASTWFPEGDGDLVFKSIPSPSAAPPIASIKDDFEWERAEVAVNVRRWLPYLGMSPPELATAEAEWETIFQELPLDGDISSLPDTQLLVWPTLPTRDHTSSACTSQNRSEAGKPLHTILYCIALGASIICSTSLKVPCSCLTPFHIIPILEIMLHACMICSMYIPPMTMQVLFSTVWT